MTVAGTVISSADNQPIVGANIYVEGTNVGTTTDAGGNYKLTVPASAKTVTVSFLGYDTKKISVRDIHLFKLITLADASNKLEDVVVVGFGVQKKESLVGAVQSVKPSDLQTSSSNLSTSFSGKIAGVIAVQKTGEPGADGANFWIRGISTFGSGQSPLLILDGVEITNQMLNNIPPETIESFSVLKDATATALYGSRGANGVMIITTKNGRDSEKMTINLRAEVGMSAPTRVPEIADGVTFMETYNEASLTRGRSPRYSDQKIMGTRLGLDPYVYPNVDWYDMLFKDASFNQNFNFNMTGGSKKLDYFLNATAYNENGIVRKPDISKYDTNINAQKYLFQANVSADATPTTRVSLKMNTQLHYRHAPIEDVSDLFKYALTAMPSEFPATLPGESSDTFTRFGVTDAWNGSLFTNPYAQLCRGYGDQFRGHFTSALTVDQDLGFITKGLSATGMATFYNRVYSAVYRSFTPFMYQLTDYNIDEAGNYSYTSNSTNTGTTYLGTTRGKDGYRELAFQAKIDYARTFGKHDVGATIVYMQKERNMNISDEQEYAALPYRQQGLAGRVTYGFDKRYLFEANFGYNGSENFAKGKRFGFFPAYSAAWNIGEEPWIKKVAPWVDMFKVRYSYGKVGNDYLETRFPFQGRFFTDDNDRYIYGDFGTDNFTYNGISYLILANKDITWEVATKHDVGLDFYLFGNKFSGTVDYFRETRNGIFMWRSFIPEIIGVSNSQQPAANVGSVRSSGVDGNIAYSDKIGNVNFTIRGNFTYSKSKILEYDEQYSHYGYKRSAGYRVDQTRGLVALGLFKDYEDIRNSPDQSGLKGDFEIAPGDIKYKDVNGDGKIDDNDIVPIGSTTKPNFIYGFGASASWKGFDVNVLFQGVGKSSFFINGYTVYPFSEKSWGNILTDVVGNYWQLGKNEDVNAKYPRLTYGKNSNNNRASTFWLRDGSYLRLKNVEIGYTLPKSLTSRINIQNVRVYVMGTNLLTFSDFKLWDPELGSSNGQQYPLSRTFTLGMTINL